MRKVWKEGADGWWLDAVRGFTSPGTGCHVFHEDTIADLCADFNGRQPCSMGDDGGACDECAEEWPPVWDEAAIDHINP